MRSRRCSGRDRATRHAPDEPVPTPRDRLDERRFLRIVAQRCAQSLDCSVQAVLEIDERAVRPETLTQVVAGDHFTRALQHEPENLERLLLEAYARRPMCRNALPAFLDATQLPRRDIELKLPESQDPHTSHS